MLPNKDGNTEEIDLKTKYNIPEANTVELKVLADLVICSQLATVYVKLIPKLGFGYLAILSTFWLLLKFGKKRLKQFQNLFQIISGKLTKIL